jgi:hypothetical protein
MNTQQPNDGIIELYDDPKKNAIERNNSGVSVSQTISETYDDQYKNDQSEWRA